MSIWFNSSSGNSGGSHVGSGSKRSGYSRSYGAILSNGTKYTDDEYLDIISQYKDKPYYDYLLTNPWLFSKQGAFEPNLGQKILGALGDESAAVNYYNTLKSNQMQWLSEALERYRQEDYNSPSSQVQRERLAGLNPDLNGNINPGSAAENDQPIIGNPQFGEDGSLQAIGSFFMSIYSLASGFAKDMFSFQSMSNQLVSEDLNINKDIVSQATEFMKGAIGTPKRVKGDDGEFRWEFPDLALDKVEQYARTNFRSRSSRNRFINEVNSSYSSARSRFAQFGIMKSAEDASSALAHSLGVKESLGSNGSFDLDPIISVSRELNSLAVDIDNFQKNYIKEYYSHASGSSAASAENAQNEGIVLEQDARSYQRGMDKILNNTMNRIVKSLEDSSKLGGFEGLLAKGMLMYLSAFRMQMLPSLPSVNLRGLVDNRTNFFESSK